MYQGSRGDAWIPAFMQICLHFTENLFAESLTMLFSLDSFADYVHLTFLVNLVILCYTVLPVR